MLVEVASERVRQVAAAPERLVRNSRREFMMLVSFKKFKRPREDGAVSNALLSRFSR